MGKLDLKQSAFDETFKKYFEIQDRMVDSRIKYATAELKDKKEKEKENNNNDETAESVLGDIMDALSEVLERANELKEFLYPLTNVCAYLAFSELMKTSKLSKEQIFVMQTLLSKFRSNNFYMSPEYVYTCFALKDIETVAYDDRNDIYIFADSDMKTTKATGSAVLKNAWKEFQATQNDSIANFTKYFDESKQIVNNSVDEILTKYNETQRSYVNEALSEAFKDLKVSTSNLRKVITDILTKIEQSVKSLNLTVESPEKDVKKKQITIVVIVIIVGIVIILIALMIAKKKKSKRLAASRTFVGEDGQLYQYVV